MAHKTEQAGTTRQRIVEAARALLQGENADFSMRALSDKAGVSSATPYNLFGSKDGIIAALVDEDLKRLQAALVGIDADPVEAFFKIVDISAEIFTEAPALYKAGSRIIGAGGASGGTDEATRRSFHEPRFLVLRGLVADAIQAGAIDHRVNADTFAIQMGQQILSWILTWGNDQVELEEMRLRANYAIAVSLAGVATKACRDAMQDRALELQAELQKRDRMAFGLARPAGGRKATR